MKTGHLLAGFVIASWVAVPVAILAKQDHTVSATSVAATPMPVAPYQGVSPATIEPEAVPATTAVVVAPFGPKDVALSVKVKEKKCFGSAGCNLVYEIKAGWTRDLEDDCEVTYEVKGFEDGAQVGTLTIQPDGHYKQDSYQYGGTSSSSKKLTVRATEVECG